MKVHLGLSTCPNDTFAFAALLEGRSERFGLDFEFELLDVEELNSRLIASEFDVAKGSFAMALRHGDELGVLPVGSAIGFGNGPLLLAREDGREPRDGDRVLCPGENTTAHLLYRSFYSSGPPAEHVVFSDILPALESGDADFGVCIHEGRFTYAQHGLHCLADLGQVWEDATGAPLPLGGLFARRDRDPELLRRVSAAIFESLEDALAQPTRALPAMRTHAQEFDDDVLMSHVDLYVNEHTRDLAPEGRAALRALAERAETAPLAELGTQRVFHIAPKALWEDPGYQPSSLETEGFVHMSLAPQLAGTLAAHFQGAGELILAEFDGARMLEHMRLEGSRGGALFPHLYGPLNRDHVLDMWLLPSPDVDARDLPGRF